MLKRYDRFECRREDAGTWTVWDKLTHAPAALGGAPLTGQKVHRASAACEILTRIYRSRLDQMAAAGERSED